MSEVQTEMTTERTGPSDPSRTLELLWRHSLPAPVRRGPARAWTVDDVIDSAIALANGGGLESVTIRSVAESISVSPMSLYTYVPGKDELVEVMLDTVYSRMERPPLSALPWRERLVRIAEANRRLHQTHPWTVDVATVRPPLGPGFMAKYEHELQALEGLGLDDVEMDSALSLLLSFVQAIARAQQEASRISRDSGMTEVEWWSRNGPLLSRLITPAQFPLASRVGTAAGQANGGAFHADQAYTFGLERLLDGLDVLIRSRTPRTPSKRRATTRRTR